MHILHTAVRMPRDKESAAAARVGRAFTNAKARRAIDVDGCSPRRMCRRELAAAVVPAGKMQNAACRRICGAARRRAAVFRMMKKRFLNAESLALARIRPDAAAFPVARAYEVKKIRKRKMQQPYSRFMSAARMKPALIYEGGLAAARASLPLRRRACRRVDICAVLCRQLTRADAART